MDLVDLSDTCFFYRERCFTAVGFLSAGDGDAPCATFFLFYLVGIVSLRCFPVVFPSWSVCSALRCFSLGCGLLLCGADPLVPKRLRAASSTLAIFRICQCRGTPARRNQELSMIHSRATARRNSSVALSTYGTYTHSAARVPARTVTQPSPQKLSTTSPTVLPGAPLRR